MAIAQYEEDFVSTIQRTESVRQMAKLGQVYAKSNNQVLINQALSQSCDAPVFLEDWTIPSGVYG